MAQKIIFDTDPGVDDSMALLLALASPELEVLGVTTVFCNGTVEQTTRNAQHVLELAGRSDAPVVAGAYPAPDAAVSFVHDLLGRRTVMTDGTGTTSWAYDGLDRPLTITQPYVGSVGYSYDSAGTVYLLSTRTAKSSATPMIWQRDWPAFRIG